MSPRRSESGVVREPGKQALDAIDAPEIGALSSGILMQSALAARLIS
jgi:hypothetical protein